MRRLRLLAALGLFVMLAACGFQLRRPVTLPFSTLYVQANAPLKDNITRAVQMGTQARVVDSPQAAQAVLEVTHENQEQRILSLNALGQVAAYTLYERVTFQLRDARGGTLLAPQTIEQTRDLEYDPSKVLSLSNAQSALYQDMRNEVANQIMWRLRALSPAG